MLEAKIRACLYAINSLAGEIDEDKWLLLRRVRDELLDCAEMARNIFETVELKRAYDGQNREMARN